VRLWHILHSRLRSLLFRNRREADLREELQFHLERETERLEAEGMRPDAARAQALRTFGALEPTKEACRDARGIELVDTLARDIRYFTRSLSRAPLVALTIVTTVGLGLGLVAVVFTVLNAVIYRVDDVRDPDELFVVDRQRVADGEPQTLTRFQYQTIIQETDVFADAFASTPTDAWIEGLRREGHLVTGNFFQVLGVSAALGRTFAPSDDEPGRPAVLVLSHRAWSQQYAGDPGVVNRSVRVNGTSFRVIGVMPEHFRGLQAFAAPDFWAPLSLLGQFRSSLSDSDTSIGVEIIGRLTRGLSRERALAKLRVWDSRTATERGGEQPTASLVLEPKLGTVAFSSGALIVFTPLFFAFGLILMIGCANVANLLLARGIARQPEIGIRLAIGATRRRIVWQLLTENLLLALISAGLAFVLSRLVLAGVVYAVTSTFPPELGDIRLAVPPADWRVAGFLVIGAMVSTLFFALAPALHATRLEVVRAIRGELARNAGPGRARNALVALQVTGSVLLLICAVVFLRSSWAASTIDPGIRTVDTVMLDIVSERSRGVILEAVRNEPLVSSVAASWPGGIEGLGGRRAIAEGATGSATVTYQFVSPEYFDVLGIELLRGRSFTTTERSAAAPVTVVSERVARQLWPDSDALGQVLQLEVDPQSERREPDDPPLLSRSFLVVGVARDVPGFQLGGQRLPGAGLYVPISAETTKAGLTVRVRGDAERARLVLIDRLATIDANLGDIVTLQSVARGEAYLLGIAFWLTLSLGVLALLLTVSGLFSVLSYLVEQRTREIGVRMALGATSQTIGALVLSQSARPVGIGLLLGSSFAAAMGAALLATPAAEQIGSVVRLFDPLAYATALTCIVTACAAATLLPALRAGRIDPVTALRHD
jgi:putative ABC transport system permease protein